MTYDAGAGPRVGALEGEGVIDLGFDGDMVAFIAAGAPAGRRARSTAARACSRPLRPRSLRDFLAFEGHMQAALTRGSAARSRPSGTRSPPTTRACPTR